MGGDRGVIMLFIRAKCGFLSPEIDFDFEKKSKFLTYFLKTHASGLI